MELDREADFLKQLAERPDDRALRLVFADFLIERGDVRGEVIALCERGQLSLTERRRVARLTAQHRAQWLGPLAALCDVPRTRFEGGFLDELVCQSSLLLERGPLLEALVGEPRLVTTRSLVVPGDEPSGKLAPFLLHPIFRGLARVELHAAAWRSLRDAPLGAVRPEVAVVSSFGAFEQELTPLRGVPLFENARVLGLSTTEFLSALTVGELFAALERQHQVVDRFHEVQLLSRYSVMEGTAAWLLSIDLLKRSLLQLSVWSVEANEVVFRRTRVGNAFDRLEIDLSLPETQGEKQSAGRAQAGWNAGQPLVEKTVTEVRIASAASVLVQLAPAKLREVEVKLAPGARLKPTERGTLLAASRRSGSLERFTIDGEPLTP